MRSSTSSDARVTVVRTTRADGWSPALRRRRSPSCAQSSSTGDLHRPLTGTMQRARFVPFAHILFLVCISATVMPLTVNAQTDPVLHRHPTTLTVGEHLTYDVKFGPIRVGRASMEVVGIEEIRGRRAWHTRFQITGGTMFFRVNDVLESWIDVETFSSLRYRQQLSEGPHDRHYDYEIFPERMAFVRQGKPERPSVAHPLDDGSFLYFLRTVPLEVGATYEFHRYFIPDRNPVRLDVLRTEAIEVPAGRYEALLIRPVIKTQGVFSENGRAQVWVSNDPDHVLLQMTSHLKFGSLTLQLRSRTVRTPADAASRSEPEHR